MHAQLDQAFSGEARQRPPAQAAVDSEVPDAGSIPAPRVDRRKTERRGMDALRAEALRVVISKVEDRNFGGLRSRVQWSRRLPPSRILLLVVAVAAGGLAAFMAVQRTPPLTEALVQPAAEVVQEARVRILAARTEIGVGQRLSPEILEWVDWPEGAVRSEYITVAAEPEAITGMTGAVARFEFFPGEPIRAQKLAQPGDGYLSAVLDGGMRGVSVAVAAAAASGGFVVPNDRVDVVLTRASAAGQSSETILTNVRVLAINARLGEAGTTGAPEYGSEDPRSRMFSDTAIATLELDSTGAELIINATTLGTLALVLRPIVDAAEPSSADEHAANLAIRLSSPFWSNDNAGSTRQ